VLAPRPGRLDQLIRRSGVVLTTGLAHPREASIHGHRQGAESPGAHAQRRAGPKAASAPSSARRHSAERSPSMPHGQNASACPNLAHGRNLSHPEPQPPGTSATRNLSHPEPQLARNLSLPGRDRVGREPRTQPAHGATPVRAGR
jgi:hypothetical protein